MYLRVAIFELILFRVYEPLAFVNLYLFVIGKIFLPLLLQIVSPPVFFSSFSRTTLTWILEVLIFSYRSLRICLFFWKYFFLCSSDWIILLALLAHSLSGNSIICVLLLSHPVNFSFQIYFYFYNFYLVIFLISILWWEILSFHSFHICSLCYLKVGVWLFLFLRNGHFPLVLCIWNAVGLCPGHWLCYAM